MRPVREWRGRPLETIGEKLMGAVSALEWTQAGGHVDEVIPQAFRALAGGELQQRDPNLLTLAALLPLIVGDRDEALRLFDLGMVEAHRRGSLFAVTGMYLWRGFSLFWRGDLIDAEEELRASFDQAESWGYGPDTLQWNAAHLSWCLTERGNLGEARTALMRARERGGRSDGARYWCNARLELLVAEGSYEEAVEAADEYADRFRHYHNPAAARWSGLRAVALDALGMKRKAIELAAEELDRARDWGAPGTVARSLRVLGLLEGPEGLERLEEAVELVAKGSCRLELAKSLAGLGGLRRLAGRPDYAREPLTRAHELAEVCGAERLLQHHPERAARGGRSAGLGDAARRGVPDRDRAPRGRLGRRGPGRARDRAGAVRDPADHPDQAGQRAAQAGRDVAGRARDGARNLKRDSPALGSATSRQAAGNPHPRRCAA